MLNVYTCDRDTYARNTMARSILKVSAANQVQLGQVSCLPSTVHDVFSQRETFPLNPMPAVQLDSLHTNDYPLPDSLVPAAHTLRLSFEALGHK